MSEHKIGRRDALKAAALSGMGLGMLGTNAHASKASAAVAAVSSTPMPRRELGTTGQTIPRLLLGCSQKFDPFYDKVLHRAFKEEINYLDSAQVYANGQSHKTLAVFLEQIGDREKLWITSKVFLAPSRATPEMYVKNFEKMLPDLKTDHLDMFFMHGIKDPKVLEPEFIKMGEDLKKRGMTKFFGFSCHDGTVVELLNKAAMIGSAGIDAIQFRYNFAMYGDLELNKAIDACRKAGIGLIAMKTMASVPEDGKQVKKFRSDNFTLPQAKLKAVWADDRIDAAVSEMTNIQQLEENVAAVKSEVELSMNEFMQLNQYAAQTASSRCVGCDQHCESAVDGNTRIADTLRFLMYHECYERGEDARRMYRSLTAQERNIAGVDFTAAAQACPQGIDIAKRLAEAQRVFA